MLSHQYMLELDTVQLSRTSFVSSCPHGWWWVDLFV